MSIRIQREALLRRLGYRDPPQARILGIVEQMIVLTEDLMEPRSFFQRIEDDRDLPSFLEGAELKYLGAATLGPNLENRVKEFFDQGKPAEGYILDTAGSMAANEVGDLLWEEIGREAGAKGFKKGIRRTPGCRGIGIDVQEWIFKRLPSPDLGITLTRSFMMVPRKSLSFLARFGGRMGRGFSCRGCPQYMECTLRR